MITYVVDTVQPLVDEVLVVTNTENNRGKISRVIDSKVKIVLDESHLKSPLIGALTGFKHAKGKYSLLLACDTPLISRKVISLLLELITGNDAVVPKWPSGYIEPLQAIYDTQKGYEASFQAILQKELRMKGLITRLKDVLYISTLELSKLDSELHTFLNVNLPKDFTKLERILHTTRNTNENHLVK